MLIVFASVCVCLMAGLLECLQNKTITQLLSIDKTFLVGPSLKDDQCPSLVIHCFLGKAILGTENLGTDLLWTDLLGTVL